MRFLALVVVVGCAPKTGEEAESTESSIDDIAVAEAYELPDEAGFPEGVSFHAETRGFYLSSLEHGTLQRVDLDGTLRTVFDPGEEGWSTLGTKVADGMVLMCAVRDASTPSAVSELWVHDPTALTTDRIELLGSPSNCNDVVAIGSEAFLTDREAAQLHRVDLATGTAEIWLEHTLLTPGIIGNNGIVATDDALLVGQFSPAKLLRIPLDAPEGATEVVLEGDSLGSLPNGADGMEWFERELIIAAHGRIASATTADNWSTAALITADTEIDIVAVTEAEGLLMGLNGEVIPYVLGTEATLPFQLVALAAP